MSSQWETIQFSLKPQPHLAPYIQQPPPVLPHLFFMLTKQTELQCAAEIGQVVFILLHLFYLTFADKFSGGGVKRRHTYQHYISFSDRISNFLVYTFKKCGELYNALTLKHCLSPSCSDVETVGLSGAEMLSKADLSWAATDAKPLFIFSLNCLNLSNSLMAEWWVHALFRGLSTWIQISSFAVLKNFGHEAVSTIYCVPAVR